MQNTVVERAEVRFLRILYPLLQRSYMLKKYLRVLVEATRKSVNNMDELLEERYQNVYLLICVLCGLGALGIGYAAALFLGR